MKKLLMAVLAVSLVGVAPAFADHDMNVDEKVAKLKTELGLSAEQEATVKQALNDYKDGMKRLKDEKKARIDAALNDEQKKKHEAMIKEWKEKRKEEKKS